MLEVETSRLRQDIEALLRAYPDLGEDEFLRADMLEGETDLHKILTEIFRMIDDAKALRDGTDARMADLKARRERMEHRANFGRELILKILDTANLRKVELPEVTLSLRNNPRQIVGDPTPDILPDELVRVVRSPDKTKIREWLEAGREVPGCVLSNAPPSLTVRVK
jgi:hypothetical protein